MPRFVWIEVFVGAMSLSGAIFHLALALRAAHLALKIPFTCLAISVILVEFISPRRYLSGTHRRRCRASRSRTVPSGVSARWQNILECS